MQQENLQSVASLSGVGKTGHMAGRKRSGGQQVNGTVLRVGRWRRTGLLLTNQLFKIVVSKFLPCVETNQSGVNECSTMDNPELRGVAGRPKK